MPIVKAILILSTLLATFVVKQSVYATQSLPDGVLLSELSLPSHEVMIFKEPWQAYQQILTLEASTSQSTDEQRLWLLIRKAQCEDLLYFYPRVAHTVTQLLALVSAETPDAIKAHVSYFQGLILQRDGDYRGARPHFKQAMELAKTLDDHYLYVKAKLELAYTHSLAELFDTSLADMQEVYIEAFALKDEFLIATINETYGAIYGYMRQYDKSLDYHEKALATYEKLGYKAHIAEAIYGIASAYRYWKKYELAAEKFRLYQQKLSYTPNSNISYFGAYGLGMTLAEQGNCPQALPEIEKAFTLEGLDDYDAELYKRKASCLIKLGQLDEAEHALNQAKRLFHQMPQLLNTAWHIEVDKIAGELAYARQDHQSAYLLLASYYQRYSDILIENSSTRVATIRASMEIERQEIEKALSNQRVKAEQLAFKAQAQEALQQRYFIIFLCVVLSIVLAVVVYQHRTNRKITELSIVDAHSGLYNRRYIFNYLDKLMQGISSEHSTLSIIVFDIDDFKQINDNYGHPSGDLVIEQVANIALEALRTEDVVGRIGGEEFLCVLPRTDAEQGQTIAERIRLQIENHQFSTEQGHIIALSASFGVAQYSPTLAEPKLLYGAADQALYLAKEQGKNSVVAYHQPL